MRTATLRYSGLGIFLLVLAGALLLAWLHLSHAVFATITLSVFFFAVLGLVGWDGWRKTTPESLESRGMYPDDRSLQVFDPGLSRDYCRCSRSRSAGGRP